MDDAEKLEFINVAQSKCYCLTKEVKQLAQDLQNNCKTPTHTHPTECHGPFQDQMISAITDQIQVQQLQVQHDIKEQTPLTTAHLTAFTKQMQQPLATATISLDKCKATSEFPIETTIVKVTNHQCPLVFIDNKLDSIKLHPN
uniref:Uncharacterized protein n=1 Tax=Romanomermis culicivorax TaxID=13658 RepID=A0A915J3J1_ROMCU